MNNLYLKEMRNNPPEAINYAIRAAALSAFEQFLGYYFQDELPQDLERLVMSQIDVLAAHYGGYSDMSFMFGVLPLDKDNDLDFFIKISISDAYCCKDKLSKGKNGPKGVYLSISMWDDENETSIWPSNYFYNSLHDIITIADVYYTGQHDAAVKLAKELGHYYEKNVLDLNTWKMVKLE